MDLWNYIWVNENRQEYFNNFAEIIKFDNKSYFYKFNWISGFLWSWWLFYKYLFEILIEINTIIMKIVKNVEKIR